MNSRWYYNQPVSFRRATFITALVTSAVLMFPPRAHAGDAPAWMHAVVSAPLPEHDDKTDAVLLYSDTVVNVQSDTKVSTTIRRAYKILRPDGRDFGLLVIPFGSH